MRKKERKFLIRQRDTKNYLTGNIGNGYSVHPIEGLRGSLPFSLSYDGDLTYEVISSSSNYGTIEAILNVDANSLNAEIQMLEERLSDKKKKVYNTNGAILMLLGLKD